jgi:hypothetical protein
MYEVSTTSLQRYGDQGGEGHVLACGGGIGGDGRRARRGRGRGVARGLHRRRPPRVRGGRGG